MFMLLIIIRIMIRINHDYSLKMLEVKIVFMNNFLLQNSLEVRSIKFHLLITKQNKIY